MPAIIIIAIIAVLGGVVVFLNHNKTVGKPSNPTSTADTKSSQLVIKDFGIVITLPKDLIGTNVETVKQPAESKFTVPPTVNLILNKYSYTVTGCLGNKYNLSTPFASLSMINGKPQPDDTQLMKQFNGFYIERIGNGLKLTCKDQATQAAFDGLNNEYSRALKNALSGARLI